MLVLLVKSTARKPACSMAGAAATTSGVVRPVAPQRLWLPSRTVVSTSRTTGPLVKQRHHALVAVHANPLAGLDGAGREPGPDQRRQTVLPGHDRGVAHPTHHVRDGPLAYS